MPDESQQKDGAVKTWPERIYLQTEEDETPTYDDISRKYEVTWCVDQIDEGDVPYIRADLCQHLSQETKSWQGADQNDLLALRSIARAISGNDPVNGAALQRIAERLEQT